jgi:hypothetical protein
MAIKMNVKPIRRISTPSISIVPDAGYAPYNQNAFDRVA